MSGLHKTVGLCVGFIAIVVGLFFYSVTREPILSVEALREQGVFILPRPREIAAFEMSDHTGKPFGLEDLQGHWTFAFFGFTNCPDVCPTTMATLGKARRSLGVGSMGSGDGSAEMTAEIDAFQGLLITVDPERDDGETLGRYATAFADDFIGLRGSREETAAFAEQVNATFARVPVLDATGSPSATDYQVDHSANVVIINPRGHYHGFIKYPQQADTIVAAYKSLTANF